MRQKLFFYVGLLVAAVGAACLGIGGGMLSLRSETLGAVTTFVGGALVLVCGVLWFHVRVYDDPLYNAPRAAVVVFLFVFGWFGMLAGAPVVFDKSEAEVSPAVGLGAVGLFVVWPVVVGQYVLRRVYRTIRGVVDRSS